MASHHLLLMDILRIFLGVPCFSFPRSLSFDFSYDLDIWAQGQALRAFFVLIGFSTVLTKNMRGFDQTWQEAS